MDCRHQRSCKGRGPRPWSGWAGRILPFSCANNMTHWRGQHQDGMVPNFHILSFERQPSFGSPVLIGCPAPGPGTAARHLGRRPGQPGPQRDLWVPVRRVRPGRVVGGRGPGGGSGSSGSALAAVGGLWSGRPIRHCYSVHRRPGQGRQTNEEQVEPRYALRGGVQTGS
jgi:hypothetical protein